MQEIHVYRGFAITVLVENDPAGGSSVTTRIDRAEADAAERAEWTAPRLARSPLRGKAAIGAAVDDARHAIDSALGERGVLEE